MTLNIPAGAKVRASVLNAEKQLIVVATTDTSRTSNTTLLSVTDLAIALEANTTYAFDMFLAYDAGVTGDIKCAFTVPSGASISWAGWGLTTGTTGSFGDMTAQRADGSGTTLAFGGSATLAGVLACAPRGYVTTGGTTGNLQFQFAQNTSNGTATTIKSGSWLRAQKVT